MEVRIAADRALETKCPRSAGSCAASTATRQPPIPASPSPSATATSCAPTRPRSPSASPRFPSTASALWSTSTAA